MTTARPIDRLRPAAISVPLGGFSFTIPSLPAAQWITAISDTHMEMAVLPGLLPPREAWRLEEMLMDEHVSNQQLNLSVYRAISDASGRDWWQTLRLVGAAADETGRILGELELRGVDPHAMTLARWVSAVYALLTQNMDEKELFKFSANLMLVPGIEGLEIEDRPDDAAQVMAMLRTMPGVSIGG